MTTRDEVPEKRTPLIVTLVVTATLLTGGVVAYALLPSADEHGCKPGYTWGYDGDQTAMTPEEVEAASSCSKDSLSSGASRLPLPRFADLTRP